jgi:hypothetical protein
MARNLIAAFCSALAAGCVTGDVPQAHRGQVFEKTGFWVFYSGGKGFTGEILPPGTYKTGVYKDIHLIDCSMVGENEPLAAVTKDGVQFGLEINVRFSADCSPETVKHMLTTLIPDRELTITGKKLYELYVRPTISEAVLQVVSPYKTMELNDKRQEILTAIRKRFLELIEAKQMIRVYELTLSKPQFPPAIDAANVDRAVQAVMRDKAIAERERVKAEIETSAMRRQLAENEGEEVAAKIDKVGAALRRNPQFLQYDLQDKLPDIYRGAGAAGNMIITAPNPTIMMPPKLPVPPQAPAAGAPSSRR